MNKDDFTKEVRRRLASGSRVRCRLTHHVAVRGKQRHFNETDVRTALERGAASGQPHPADLPYTGWTALYYHRDKDGHALEIEVNLPDNNSMVIAITAWRRGR